MAVRLLIHMAPSAVGQRAAAEPTQAVSRASDSLCHRMQQFSSARDAYLQKVCKKIAQSQDKSNVGGCYREQTEDLHTIVSLAAGIDLSTGKPAEKEDLSWVSGECVPE